MRFDRLAPHYDWMEKWIAGRHLHRARTAWLDQLEGCRRILSVGEGHGRFAAACLARFPEAELICVDASSGMLAQARRRLHPTAAARVRWHQTDALQWRPDAPCDAIVTCFFLDCFPPATLAAVIAHLAGAATPDARWLVADFTVPPRGPARWRALAVHRLMYAFFCVVGGLPARRLTPPDRLLQAHGFSLAGRRTFNWGLLHSDVWQRGHS